MAVNYFLTQARLRGLEKQIVAKVAPKRILTEEDIAQDMANRAGIKKEFALANIRLMTTCVCDALEKGESVFMGLANFGTKISGKFENYEDGFEEYKNKAKGDVRPGRELTKRLKHLKFRKIVKPSPNPKLVSFIDIFTNAIDTILTAGSIGLILGKDLKFDATNLKLGVFFISEDNTATRAMVYSKITDGRITFLIPATLKPGTYKLEVRNVYSKVNPEIRMGVLNKALLVSDKL